MSGADSGHLPLGVVSVTLSALDFAVATVNDGGMAIITVTRDREPGFFARSRAEFSQGIRCTECGWGNISNDPHHLRHSGEVHETYLCPKRPGTQRRPAQD